MRRQLLMLSAAAVAATVTLSACSSSGNQAATSSTSASTAIGSASASATQAHNPADVTFAQNMLPCHQQAIQMSNIILAKQGIDPRVVQLANQIKAAEGPEIQQMQSWLSQWGQPTTPMMPSQSTMPSPGRRDARNAGNDDVAEANDSFAERARCRCQQAIPDDDDPKPSGRNHHGAERN
jgi:uncharacterized protein (DUF305 family)